MAFWPFTSTKTALRKPSTASLRENLSDQADGIFWRMGESSPGVACQSNEERTVIIRRTSFFVGRGSHTEGHAPLPDLAWE